eukprot:augustus_masked-scaffold_53-processed-gene-1.28-mRNA-1 protein AED:1.00 eAED:1.00 QI:0/-1/0/0/-1/1/1/0/220
MGSGSSRQRRESYVNPPPRGNKDFDDSNPLAAFQPSYSTINLRREERKKRKQPPLKKRDRRRSSPDGQSRYRPDPSFERADQKAGPPSNEFEPEQRSRRGSRDTNFFDRPFPSAVVEFADVLGRSREDNIRVILASDGPLVLNKEKYAGFQTWLCISILFPCIGPFSLLLLFCPIDETNRQVVEQQYLEVRSPREERRRERARSANPERKNRKGRREYRV